MPPKSKDTGLAAFTDSPQEEEEKRSPTRTKGKGKYVHNQLRMTHDQWELSHQFARSEGISLNRLALLGISKLREEKGLPGLPDL